MLTSCWVKSCRRNGEERKNETGYTRARTIRVKELASSPGRPRSRSSPVNPSRSLFSPPLFDAFPARFFFVFRATVVPLSGETVQIAGLAIRIPRETDSSSSLLVG